MHIGVDYDDTVFQFMQPFLAYFNKERGTNHTYDSMDNTTFWPKLGFSNRTEAIEYCNSYYHSPEAFAAHPLPGCYEVCKGLKERGHTLSIVSARPATALPAMNRWLGHNFPGIFSEVHATDQFSHNSASVSKASVCANFGMEVMVDDAAHYLRECAALGVQCFLIDHPWNRSVPLSNNIIRVSSWNDLEETLSR